MITVQRVAIAVNQCEQHKRKGRAEMARLKKIKTLEEGPSKYTKLTDLFVTATSPDDINAAAETGIYDIHSVALHTIHYFSNDHLLSDHTSANNNAIQRYISARNLECDCYAVQKKQKKNKMSVT